MTASPALRVVQPDVDKTPERWIVIPRWQEFQHYKDRDPFWIKDYVRQLRNDDWLDLTLSQRGLLAGLRLVFAETNGVVSESGARQKLVRSESDARYWKRHLEALNHAGFIEFSSSKPLAKEKEKEKETSLPRASARVERKKGRSLPARPEHQYLDKAGQK